jgi:hypothetical protein
MTYTISIDDTKNWEILRQKLNGFFADIDSRLTTTETDISDLTAQQGLVFLSHGSITTPAVSLDIALPGGYAAYKLFLTNTAPVTINTALGIRVSVDNGSTYKAGSADYSYAGHYTNTNVTDSPFRGSSTVAAIQPVGANDDPGYAQSIELTIYRPSGDNTAFAWQGWGADNSGNLLSYTGGARSIWGGATNLRLLYSAGNIANATWALYGVNGL